MLTYEKAKPVKFNVFSDYVGFAILCRFPLILNLGVLNCPFNIFCVLATARGVS